jgi:hypothetical protein
VPQHLAPGVIHIATSKTNNAYLIDDDDGLTLVDVGSGKAVDLLLRTITEAGSRPRRPEPDRAHPCAPRPGEGRACAARAHFCPCVSGRVRTAL